MSEFTPEQVEEILQLFFENMAHRQYIGARYVPIFGRKDETSCEWDNTAPYEPLTIVLYEGNSYTSRQFVPTGVSITNESYWANTGNYNAQVEAYRQEVFGLMNIIPSESFDAEHTVYDAINGINVKIGSGFDATNNIASVIGSGFDHENSVASAISDIETIIGSGFDSENTIADSVEYLMSKKVFAFDTVAEMKASTELVAGAVAHTNGYHASGDGGASWYKIAESGTANNMTVISCGDLFAVMIVTDGRLSPEQLGAKGNDSDFDSTDIIQFAIDYVAQNNLTLCFPQKTYYISDTLEITRSYTHIETDNYNVRGITKPNLVISDANKPIFNILGEPVGVEFGGTIENVTIKRIGMDRSVDGGASSCGIRVRYAQFVYFDEISICHSCHDIEFANFNGLHITNCVFSNDTEYNGACFYKTNDEGSTGLELHDIVYYTEIESKFLYHHTDSGQSGDIVIDNIEIAGPVSNIVDMQANSGFACHNFFSKISADHLTSQAFYLHNSSQNGSQSVEISEVWVLGSGTGAGICDLTNVIQVQFNNITLGCNANMDNPIIINGCKGIVFDNVHLTPGMSSTNTRVAQFSNGSTGCIIKGLYNGTSGAIWLSSGCNKNIIVDCILTESVQDAGTGNIIDNNITTY